MAVYTWSRFLPITETRSVLGPYSQSLRPLLTRHIACLIWMPYLLAMVAELGLASFPLTGQLWAAGTAIGNNSITGYGNKKWYQKGKNDLTKTDIRQFQWGNTVWHPPILHTM